MTYTFLLPAYKAEYLAQSIQSILNQTYRDFTIIVSDDCSPEDIIGVVDGFNDDRIHYRRNQENMGGKSLVSHWNLLVDLCESDYLIMASDDDVYHPTFLEEINKLVEKHPVVDVLRARVHRIDDKGDVLNEDDLYEEFQPQLKVLNSIYSPGYIGCIANYVFKTKPLKEKGGFVDFPLAWFSDMASVILMSEHGQANTADILFGFRLSGQNISSISKNRQVDGLKLDATIAYDQWFSQYLKQIAFEKTPLNVNLFNRVTSEHKHRVYGQAGDYSWSIPVYKYGSVKSRFSQNYYFEKGSFYKYFYISVLNRLFGKKR